MVVVSVLSFLICLMGSRKFQYMFRIRITSQWVIVFLRCRKVKCTINNRSKRQYTRVFLQHIKTIVMLVPCMSFCCGHSYHSFHTSSSSLQLCFEYVGPCPSLPPCMSLIFIRNNNDVDFHVDYPIMQLSKKPSQTIIVLWLCDCKTRWEKI